MKWSDLIVKFEDILHSTLFGGKLSSKHRHIHFFFVLFFKPQELVHVVPEVKEREEGL